MFNSFSSIHPRWGPFAEVRRRNFEKGALKYVILDLVEEKPAYGYEVIRALEERSHDIYSPSPGSVYPILQLLADLGYLTTDEIESKKIYTITDTGKQYLKNNKESLDRINSFLEQRWPSDIKFNQWQQTFQEMPRLGQRLQGRLHELDAEQLSAIREIVNKSIHDIDAVIERSKKS